MLLPRFVVWLFSFSMMVMGASVVCGQTALTGSGQATSTGSGQAYPNKPIRIITFGVGGGSDLAARLIAQGISAPLGQPIIVDNRGSGVIPGEIVARATPDGYTLLLGAGTFWIGSLLRKTPYDPVRDFSPITLVATSPNVLVVHPSLPVKSVKDLIVLAKAKPGALNYGSSSVGGSPHLAAELFKAMTGVNIVRVNYKSSGQALNGLIGGEVQLMFGTGGTMQPQIKSGRLRAVAVASAEPSALFHGLPTVAASGLPGYESATIQGMFAPAGTPVTIINQLNQVIVQFVTRADVKQKLLDSGEEAVGSSPGEFAAKIASEMTRLGKVIKDADITAD